MKNRDLISKSLYYQLADILEIAAIFAHGDSLIYRARPRIDPDEAKQEIIKRLEKSGYTATFRDEQVGFLIYVKEAKKMKIPKVNVILFLATIVTVFFAEAFVYGILFDPSALWEYLKYPGVIGDRIEFTVVLMLILLFHEFGHYLAGRRRGIFMSLPYFLPAPTFIGTFGAVIKSRSPITNRRDLIEVGATGPVAGFVVAFIALAIGMHNSQIVEYPQHEMLFMGKSLIYSFFRWLMIGPVPDGYTVALSPSAFAGWVGLLVTMLNLLPLGQLDGGHIIYGLIGRKQYIVAKIMAVAIVVLGFYWYGWWVFGVLALFLRLNHPPTIQDDLPIGGKARILGIAAILIFVISFIPVPFSFG